MIFEVTSERNVKTKRCVGVSPKKREPEKLVQFEPEIPTGTRTNHSGKIVRIKNEDWMR